MLPDRASCQDPSTGEATGVSPLPLFLGTFQRTMTGNRFPLPAPWAAALDADTEWLYAFFVRELPEVICLTTDSFVRRILEPVLRIAPDRSGSFLVKANEARRYNPVPVDGQRRVTLSEVSQRLGKTAGNKAVPLVLFGGADYFGICRVSAFAEVRQTLEVEARKAAEWALAGAQAVAPHQH